MKKFLLFFSFIFAINCNGAVIAPGINYEKIVKQNPEPLEIHELLVNPNLVRIVLEPANKNSAKAATTSEMARRNNAIAAINAGFFDFGVSWLEDKLIKLLDLFGLANYNAHPEHELKIDDKWFSKLRKPTGFIAWSDGGLNAAIGAIRDRSFDYVIEESQNLLGSTTILLKDGVVPEYVIKNERPFFTTKHPRTSVGILPDGRWLMVVIDGRQSFSKGITLKDLALYMKERGCVNALNLGGGGDTTMVINNKIVNSVSGRRFTFVRAERAVANAILIMPR